MTAIYDDSIVAALTVVTGGAFGLLARAATPSDWFMLAAVAIPPAVFMRHRKPLAPESIQRPAIE